MTEEQIVDDSIKKMFLELKHRKVAEFVKEITGFGVPLLFSWLYFFQVFLTLLKNFAYTLLHFTLRQSLTCDVILKFP